MSQVQREAALKEELETVLGQCLERYRRIAFTCSFGGTSIVIAHAIAMSDMDIPVYFLDTGLLFAETLAARRRFEQRFGLRVIDVGPALSLSQQAERHGGELWLRDPDLCCALRKVEPMQRLLGGVDAWITGLRRDQSLTRGQVEVFEHHGLEDGRTIAKVNPMAHWTRQDAWQYIQAHDLPYNILLDQGYRSIGCRTCTGPVATEDDERAGRWAGRAKTECGLHTFTRRLPEGG